MDRLSRSWTRLVAVVLIAGAGVVLLGAAPGSKVKVLSNTRLGGYTEDLAYVTTGPLAKYLVLIEGYEIWGIPNQATGKAKLRKLFDLYQLDPVPRATGIAWVESRKLFALNNSQEQTQPVQNLYFVDHKGRLKGTASMVFPLPDGYVAYYTEGMGYIPASAGQYPDHLVLAAQDNEGAWELLIVDLAGQVVKHFAPECYDNGGNLLEGVSSVEYLPGDRLAIVDYNYGKLCVVDFDGVALTPTTFIGSDLGTGEGIARLGNGRIVASEFPQNLLFFDADLNRMPDLDRHDVVGLGLDNARGLAWDGLESQHLLSYDSAAASWTANFSTGPPNAIASVPPKLKKSTPIVDLTDYPGFRPYSSFPQTFGMTYLRDESRVVLASRGQGSPVPPAGWTWSPLPWFRGLLFYEPGAPGPVEQIDLSTYGSGTTPGTIGRAVVVAHIPGATPAEGRFAVRFGPGGPADPYTAYLFSREGALLGTIDFNATAGLIAFNALEYFDAPDGTGGRLAVLGRDPTSTHMQFFVTDLDGHKLYSFDIKEKLGLPTPGEVSVITTGCQAGAFAVLDGTAETLVVFRIK